ncbi:MAG TPA: ATP-binding protein [Gemmatimonadales bacterium]|jgi:signal transduction histidine kinase/CheY-like chemotaxis protein|nr:ATP-binding protein [Gemmatimonadales bacterium]
MLDRLGDPSVPHEDVLEPLPPHWRELFEALREQLGRITEQREWLAQALERTSTEMREQLIELEALRRARSAAESANLVRGEILATVSRTMRTPADALLGLARLLRLGPLVPSQRAYADALHGAAEVLRSILNDVSDFSRLENGTLPLEPIAFDLRVMVEDLAAALGGEAQAKGVALRLIWRPETPRRVTGDPGRLRQVLRGLVQDGLSRLGQGEIVLEVGGDPARPAGKGVRMIVADSGPAIPDDLMPTLFEPFVRGDAYANRDGGLALPIAQQLAHLMGGDLAVENPKGAGTRFTLRLPLTKLLDDANAVPPDTADEQLPTSALPGALLVVDADANQRASWATIAEAAGYRATGYPTREEALAELSRRAEAGRPAAIVLFSDHGAEEYVQVGREIVADESFGKPALLMLPAVGNPGDARRLMEAGFRGYLVKPVAPADLREALETLRRTPRAAWHRLFVTRHFLAEARRGGGVREAELEASLGQLVER